MVTSPPRINEKMGEGLTPSPTEHDVQVTHITPSAVSIVDLLRELWQYRELIYFLAWRDVKVRYKQTVLGVAWAVLQPLAMAVVFTVFLGRLAGVPSDGMPYSLFVFSGLLSWQLFSHTLTESSQSLVLNERLVTRVYFPRIAIPLATLVVGLVDFVFGFVVLLLLMVYFGYPLRASLLFLPPVVCLALATSFAVGLWLSALNVRYRDVRYTLVFLPQLWLFATPVAYPSTLVPETWRAVFGLNPMTGVVEAFRWSLFGATAFPGTLLIVSTATVSAVLIGGVLYFRKMEQSFADVI